MLTTCPECRTNFRVTQEHLALRRGLVRCGQCGVVFNAYDSLLAELVAPVGEDAPGTLPPEEDWSEGVFVPSGPRKEEAVSVMPPERQRLHSDPSRSWDGPANDLKMPPALENRPSSPPGPRKEEAVSVMPPEQQRLRSEPSRSWDGPANDLKMPKIPAMAERVAMPAPAPFRILPIPAMPTPAPPVAAPVAKPLPMQDETSDSILLSELPTRSWQEPPRPARWLLPRLAALFLFGLLAFQLALILRADIAADFPDTRPTLQALCEPLGCVVPLPRQLDKKSIAASSLEHDAENKSRVRLSLLLANRTGQVQAWPRIVLTLTDMRDDLVAQKEFTPREYLARGVNLEAGMTDAEEQEIRLDLDTSTLEATGYALDLAYH